MGAAAIVIGAIALKAMGQISQTNAQAAALKNQQKVAKYNAAVDRQQATQALGVSSAMQQQQQREARQTLGRQRAAGAQAGVGLGGSTEDVLDRSETLSELDQLNIAYNGMLKARGFTTQADLDEFQARSYKAQAKNVKKAGYMSAIGSAAASGAKRFAGGAGGGSS